MSFFRRFTAGVAAGAASAPFLAAPTVFCESAIDRARHTANDTLTSFRAALGVGKPAHDKTWGIPWNDKWDEPERRGIRNQSSSVKRQIILIRHGQYENEGIRDDGIRCLTSLGRQQAKLTGKYLRACFDNVVEQEARTKARRAAEKALKKDDGSDLARVAELEEAVRKATVLERSCGGLLMSKEPKTIYVSGLTRARETADLILESFPQHVRDRLVVDETLRERFPCDPTPPYSATTAREEDMKAIEDVMERHFYRPTTDESTVEIFVCHANVIRYLTMRLLQLPPEAWLRSSLPHCSITNILISGKGHVRISGFGSSGHLEPKYMTSNNIRTSSKL